MENETWKKIPYARGYEVSDFGRIKSLKRTGCSCDKILKSYSNTKGFQQVTMHVKGKKRQLCVHKLVAEAFMAGYENGKVSHLNGDKTDNRLCNLALINKR